MTKSEFLLKLDELTQAPEGTLTGSESLSDLAGWDSIAVMGFIALVDGSVGKRVTGKQIRECHTVDDLIKLAGISG